jgi:hypothetical protein
LNKEISAVAPSHADGLKYIRKGSIVTRPKCDRAVYYKVIDILDECTEPIVAKQSKTLVLEYIGSGATAIEHINQTIHFIPDLMPYAQMRYVE